MRQLGFSKTLFSFPLMHHLFVVETTEEKLFRPLALSLLVAFYNPQGI